jgi:hypothetical protein
LYFLGPGVSFYDQEGSRNRKHGSWGYSSKGRFVLHPTLSNFDLNLLVVVETNIINAFWGTFHISPRMRINPIEVSSMD